MEFYVFFTSRMFNSKNSLKADHWMPVESFKSFVQTDEGFKLTKRYMEFYSGVLLGVKTISGFNVVLEPSGIKKGLHLAMESINEALSSVGLINEFSRKRIEAQRIAEIEFQEYVEYMESKS